LSILHLQQSKNLAISMLNDPKYASYLLRREEAIVKSRGEEDLEADSWLMFGWAWR